MIWVHILVVGDPPSWSGGDWGDRVSNWNSSAVSVSSPELATITGSDQNPACDIFLNVLLGGFSILDPLLYLTLFS